MKAMNTQTPLLGHSFYPSTRCEGRRSRNGERMGTAKHFVEEEGTCRASTQGPGRAPPPLSVAISSRRKNHGPSISSLLRLLIISVFLLAGSSHAAFITTFNNCLGPNTINSNPKQLQFIPYWVWAFFNSSSTSHNLNVTIYGNVAGIATQQPYPGPDDPQWQNPNDTVGKIVDVSKSTNLATTLEAQFNVLDYTPYSAPATRFCNTTVQGQCPIAPNFAPNA